MIKFLSKLNIAIYAFLCAAAFFYAGSFLGVSYHININRDTLNLIYGRNYLPLGYAFVFVLFLIIGLFLAKESHYSPSYYYMSIGTVLHACCVWWINTDILSSPDTMVFVNRALYPNIVFGISVVIAINYILCGIKAKKELGH